MAPAAGPLRVPPPHGHRLQRRQLASSFELDEQPVWVDADPVQIEQALINLVTNACDAMPQGGKLHLETSRIEIVEQPWA